MSANPFRQRIKALELSGDDDEANIAAVLEAIGEQHVADRDGICQDCSQVWPCAEMDRGQYLAVLYIGRAMDRVYARSLTRGAAARPVS